MIELNISNATQYATAYRDGRPVATLQRRRVYETGPVWQAFDTKGKLLFRSYIGTEKSLAARVARALSGEG